VVVADTTTDGSTVAEAHPLSGGATTTLVTAAPGSALADLAWRPTPDPAGVDRVSGQDRYATAVEASQRVWDDGSAGAVVLARGDQFADALAGVPLANAKQGPLLLTASSTLTPSTAAELQRVLPKGKTVHLLGGTGALSAALEAQIKRLGYATVRYSGRDRFDTAMKVAVTGLGNPALLLVTNGLDFPDALSAGAAAGANEGAVVLTAGTTLPAAVKTYLEGRPTTAHVVAVGGPAATAVEADAKVHAEEPIVGSNRYETSFMVATAFFYPAPVVGIASGTTFPDALSGGATVAALGGPLLLTPATALDPEVADYLSLESPALRTVALFGGPGAVSPEVEQAAGQAAS
jgi:putative cell wall-binding protein